MKPNVIKSTVLSALILWGAVSLHAQVSHEFSLSGFGSFLGLNYKVTEGSRKNGFDGGGEFSYHLFFHPNWGMRIGVEAAFLSSKYSSEGVTLSYMAKDMNGADFVFHCKAGNYQETQKTMLLQIPLMFQFQTKGDKNRYYLALGGKAGIPVIGKYKTAEVSIQNTAYYDFEGYEYTTQHFMGFGEFDLPADDKKMNFKPAFMLSAETGGKFFVSDVVGLFFGVYFDFGLNNIAKIPEALEFIAYNPQNPTDFTQNSVLNSQIAKSITDKVVPMAVGLKFGLMFRTR
ncbi:MAG: PorT family protein [Peptococcaceae bacterium]|nr:PorT family protein [Peptococcaceae bacterium]